MSNPHPTRRSLHHAKTHESKAATGQPAGQPAGSSVEVTAGPPPSRRTPKSRKARNTARVRWTVGVGVVGALLAAILTFFGYAGHVASEPDVLAVVGPLDIVTVAGRQGSTPVVTLSDPVELSSAKMRVDFRGAGREIGPETPTLIAVTAFDGQDGTNLNEDGNPNLILGLATPDGLGPLLSRLLIGQTEGSRLVVARPLEDGGTEVDVVDILYTIAQGTDQDDSSGPLTVTFGEDGPVVSHADGEAPSGLVVQVLTRGSGPQVTAEDDVVVQYFAGTWSDNRIVASTWADGSPVIVDLTDAMPGIVDALVDRRVGSRLAVTIPAEMATGEDTLFVVVDILGRMPAQGAVDLGLTDGT